MIQKLRSNPDAVIVASDYKKVGSSVELNRERVALTFISLSQNAFTSAQKRIEDITGDYIVTPAEKQSLAREYDSLQRDFGILKQETEESDLGNSDEYLLTLEMYERLCALFEKIINSVGTYTDSDCMLLSQYYSDFTNAATALETAILNVQTNEAIINGYYSRSVAYVDIIPQSVAVNTVCNISAGFLYDGVEHISDIDEDNIMFGIVGLSPDINPATDFVFDTTTYPDSDVDYHPLTNSAEVTGCKAFGLRYAGIGTNGVDVRMAVTLDSGSMPF